MSPAYATFDAAVRRVEVLKAKGVWPGIIGPDAIEPDAVLPPGTPLPEGEIAGWVAEALSQPFEADSTFVRLLVTAPLDEIPGLFSRPLALTTGES